MLIGVPGGPYVAFNARLNTAASTVAGTQNAAIFNYRVNSCSVAAGVVSIVNPSTTDGADIETTGRMWVERRQSDAPDSSSLGISGGHSARRQLGAPGIAVQRSRCRRVQDCGLKCGRRLAGWRSRSNGPRPRRKLTASCRSFPGITEAGMLDMSTGGGCTNGVQLTGWTNLGSREAPGGIVRADHNTVQLDLGKPFPPNNKPYDEALIPDVVNVEHQNQFFAIPTFPGGLSQAQRESVRATFSLANWGSQFSTPTAASWRPIPGGTDVHYTDANAEARFVWPGPAEPTAPGSFVTTLVRNINKFLNNDPGPKPAGAQNPHQCMLVELSAEDPTVVVTTSSAYTNMNVASASTFRRAAEISVVGAPPISAQPRDVFLYVQKFNMPKVVDRGGGDGDGNGSGDLALNNALKRDPTPRSGGGLAGAADKRRRGDRSVCSHHGRPLLYRHW